MPRPAKKQWDHLYAVWLEFMKDGKSLVEFCKLNGLSYNATQKAFNYRKKKTANKPKSQNDQISQKSQNKPKSQKGKKPPKPKKHKHDWPALKIEFMQGNFETMADFGRHIGLNPQSGNFLIRTKGWLEEKAKIQIEAEKYALSKIPEQRAVEIHSDLLKFMCAAYEKIDQLRRHHKEAEEKRNTKWTPLDFKNSVAATREMIQVAGMLQPIILKLNDRNQIKGIIEAFEAGDKDIVATVLACDKLGVPVPEGLKLIMTRAKLEPDDDQDGGNKPVDDEELEARYQAGLKTIDKQEKEFVPERRLEVIELKKEVAAQDSFKDGAVPTKPPKQGKK